MKDYNEFNLTQRLLLSLIQFIERKLFRRKWTYQDQVEFALRQCRGDKVWLCEHELAIRLCQRHESMLDNNWYITAHLSQDKFRDSIR